VYQYDEYDHALVQDRVAQFRRQVARRMSGELTEEQFRPLRLMNGLYLQLHAYMLRIAIPYGTLNARQLHKLAYIARRYDKGYAHFTTRQNLQLHWPKLEETPDILAELAEVEMHAIQTSGNCIRNTTSDQYAGAAADEIEDPRVWCEVIRQWSTLHPEFTFLPRKFKIAVTACAQDRAALKIHDIGLVMRRDAAGEVGFEVLVGGGLGRTPFLAKSIRDFLPKEDLLSYLEAILRVYNQLGRRDNKFKARIKVTVHEFGQQFIAEAPQGGCGSYRWLLPTPFVSGAECRRARHRGASGVGFGLRRLGPSQHLRSSGPGLRDCEYLAQAGWRNAGRRDVRADGSDRRPRRRVQLW